MMDEPLLELLTTAAKTMNRAFAPDGDVAAARLEFYHQFRKLWDRGIPVGMGLGHLLLKPDGECLRIERIAENGVPGENLTLIAFGGKDTELRSHPGEYRHRVAISGGSVRVVW